MNNYKLTIQYDGTNYSGWQIQENAITIQEKIASAISIITKKEINLIGSGRTDAGVHALGQVANFKTELNLTDFKFVYSLNSILPEDISIIEFEKMNENFHARFSAKKRSYLYLIAHNKSPFYSKYSLSYPELVQEKIDRLNQLSSTLKGNLDFTSFTKKNSETENKICNVSTIHWRRSGMFTIFYIEANRFLHGMVRTIVGSLLYAERNNLGEEFLKEILFKKDREAAAEAAIAKGLFLYKVRYL